MDHALAPIAAFRLKSDNRLVVVSGSWSKDPSSYACDIEVDVTEFADRVVIEASAPITRRDQERGRICPAPSVWATEKNSVWLDEPLGDRPVVTSGPLLDAGVATDPPGEAPVPRAG